MANKQSNLSKEVVETQGQIWIISCKIRGIGELIRNQDGEPSLQQHEANLGIGEILITSSRPCRPCCIY